MPRYKENPKDDKVTIRFDAETLERIDQFVKDAKLKNRSEGVRFAIRYLFSSFAAAKKYAKEDRAQLSDNPF